MSEGKRNLTHLFGCMQNRSTVKTPWALAALFVLSGFVTEVFAHESVAANYAVPDDRLVWRAYKPNIHKSMNKDLISFRPGWYVGAGVGSSEVSPEGRSGGFYVKDDRDTGFKIFAGWRPLAHWSGEISYIDTGEAGLGNVNPAIEASISDATLRYQIPTISGSYHLFGPEREIDFFARVGLSSIVNSVSDSRIPYEKQTSLQLNVGGGVQWRIAPKWFVRAEYDSFDNDASMIALSIGRYFAPHDEHRMVELPTVEPVLPEQTCEQFSGTMNDIQFEVDSDQLTLSSQQALIQTAENLLKFETLTLEIQAHTDSTASEEYNLDLSVRRAETIKQYLVDQGVDQTRLTASGFGESSPRADNSSEAGRALNRRVEFKLLNSRVCD